MIRAVFFDAGGVLYDREWSSTAFARRLLAKRGYPAALSAEGQAGMMALRREASVGLISAREMWRRALRLHGVDGSAVDALAAEVERYSEAIRPAARARETFLELVRRGKILGVITDTIYPLEQKLRWLERVGVADLLEVVSCSTAVGKKKPDPAIYRHALGRTGVRPTEAAFVGHSTDELDGARALGMTTIGINEDHDAKADHYVDSLPGLLELPLLSPEPGTAISKG